MLPDYGQGATQMFSQRNNPYCELLYKLVKQIYILLINKPSNFKKIFNFTT